MACENYCDNSVPDSPYQYRASMLFSSQGYCHPLVLYVGEHPTGKRSAVLPQQSPKVPASLGLSSNN